MIRFQHRLKRLFVTSAAIFAVFLAPSFAQPSPPGAQPRGGQIVSGAAQIRQSATATTINQSSVSAAINWQSFNIGSGQKIEFQQPSASAVTLNRVTGPDPSHIAGQITANGQIILVNPSGVLFTKGAQVNAQSVIVSAAGISNENFNAGRMVFDQAARPDAAVINQGRITVRETGLAALVAPRVQNAGAIRAKLGHVVLGGASTATLDLYGDGLVSFDVTGQVRQAPTGANGETATALVTNTGTIRAEGGTVMLSASAVDGVVQNLVAAGGRISAGSLPGRPGTITIAGTGGGLRVEGSLAATGQAAGTAGGNIQVAGSGAVTLAPTASLNASGRAGGGTVAIGTTLARAKGGAAVTSAVTATTTTIAAGARVRADATGAGKGGTIAVLGSQATGVAGAISAKGGPSGGDGGLVEVSGAYGLSLTGPVTVSAPLGMLGTILLDPTDLTITHAAAGTGSGDTTLSGAGGTLASTDLPGVAATISDGTINALTGNVVLEATHDLTVSNAVAINLGLPGQSLTLRAGNNLVISGTVTGPTPAASLTATSAIALAAGYNYPTQTASGTGGITIGASGNASQPTLNAGAGTITFAAGSSGAYCLCNMITGTLALNVTGASYLQGATSAASIVIGTLTGVSGAPYLLGTLSNLGNFTANSITNPFGSASGTNGMTLTEPAGQTLAVGGILTGGSNLTISADQIVFGTGARLTFTSIGFSTVTTTRPIELTGPGVSATAGALSIAQSDLSRVLTHPMAIGLTTSSTAVNAISLLGTIDLTGIATLLQMTGANPGGVSQSASDGLTVPALIGYSSATSVNLPGANHIPNLGAINSTGAVVINNIGATAVNYVFSATPALSGSNVTLTLAGANSTLTVAGPIKATGTLTLNIPGAITQNPNRTQPTDISAVTLTGSAASVSLVNLSNAIANLFAFSTTGGAFQMSNGVPLTLSGGFSSPAGGMSILNTKTITVTGAVNATSIAFTTQNATVATADVLLGTVGVPATLTAGGVLLQAIGGSITETNATVTSGSLSGQAQAGSVPGGGSVTLGGTNNVAQFGFSAANTLSLTSSGVLSLTSPVSATTVTLAVAGALTQTASGSITATTLTGSAGSVTLGNTGNAITTVGPLTTTTGGASVTSGGAMTVGTVTVPAGQSIVMAAPTLTPTVPLSTTGAGTLTLGGNTLTLGAGVTLTSGSSVTLAPFTNGAGFSIGGGATGVVGLANAASAQISAPTLIVGANGAVQAGSIALNQALVWAGQLDLRATGAVSQSQPITIGTLTGATGPVTLTTAGNAISNIGSVGGAGFSASGNFTLNNGTNGLSFGAPLTAPGQAVNLTAVGFSDFSGDTLNIISAATVSLSATAGLISFYGHIVGTASVALTASGGTNGYIFFGFGPNAGVTTPLLSGSATSNLGMTLGTTSSVGAIGGFTDTATGAGFSLNNGTTPLAVTGPITLGTGGVSLTSGSVSQTASGVITASAFSGSSSGAVNLGGAVNAIASLSGFTSAGNFTLNNGGHSLQLTGALSAAGQTVALASGALSQPFVTVGITAGTLTGSSSASVNLPGTNAIANLGPFTASAGFSLNNGTTGLSIGGPLTAAGQTLNLTTGPLSQTPTGAITVGTLTGRASGAVNLGAATNAIQALGLFQAGGAFTLNNGAAALSVTGTLSAGGRAVNLTSGSLSLQSSIVAATTSLSVAGAVTGTGVLTATTLAGSVGAITLSNSSIGTVGPLTTTSGGANVTSGGAMTVGAVTVPAGQSIAMAAPTLTATAPLTTTGAGTLTLAGDTVTLGAGTTLSSWTSVTLAPYISGGTFSIGGGPTGVAGLANAASSQITAPILIIGANGAVRARSIAFNQALVWPNQLDLRATGAVSESQPITVGTLTGATGAMTLATAGNAIANIGTFSTSGNFTLNNGATALNFSGPLSAAGQTVNLTAGAITQTAAGPITAGTLTGFSGTQPVTLTAATNAIANLGAFSTSAGFALNDGVTVLTITGPFAGGTTASLQLTSGGLQQTAGATISAGSLGGSFSGDVTLNQTNGLWNGIQSLTATGRAISLTNGLPLSVNTVSAATVTVSAPSLTLAGPLTGTGSVTMTASAGSILSSSPTAGLTTPLLTASASGSAGLNLSAVNAVNALGGFTDTTAGAGFQLNNGPIPLSVIGPITLGTGTVSLISGPLSQMPAGAITAGGLAGSSSGAVNLGGATNAIASLGAFNAGGDFTLNNGATALTVTGAITVGTNNVTLTASRISQTGAGAISATSLAGRVTGDLALGTATNSIASLAGLSVGGDMALQNAGDLSVSAPITLASPSQTLSLRTGGNLTLAAAITTPGNVTLSAADPSVSGFNAAGGLSLLAPIAARGDVALSDGAAGLALGNNITAAALSVTANGTIIRTGGTFSVGILSGSAMHLADFGVNPQVGTLGAFTVTGSELVLNAPGPLVLAGPIAAQFIRITAVGQITLAGSIATLGQPLSAQSGATPAPLGSFITVLPGAGGTGSLTTLSGASVVPLGAASATLRLGVPGTSASQMSFNALAAANVTLVLDTGAAGQSSGGLNVGGLLVRGTGGAASLSGQIGGSGGASAAFLASITPTGNPAYTFNSCAIATGCSTGQNGRSLNTLDPLDALFGALAAQGRVRSVQLLPAPRLGTPFGGAANPDLVWPNVSQADY